MAKTKGEEIQFYLIQKQRKVTFTFPTPLSLIYVFLLNLGLSCKTQPSVFNSSKTPLNNNENSVKSQKFVQRNYLRFLQFPVPNWYSPGVLTLEVLSQQRFAFAEFNSGEFIVSWTLFLLCKNSDLEN